MSIIESAKAELKRADFGDEDSRVMVKILETFFAQWDSGGAVSVAAPVLQRLIAGKPLTPLTGEADEWVEHDYGRPPYYQNSRCGTVFKDAKDGPAYDIARGSRDPITFPYMPGDDTAVVPPPVVIIGDGVPGSGAE